jgi:uncharacterized protein (DUF1800 family)
MSSASISPQAIALNRFGLGATPRDALPANPRAFLVSQFDCFVPLPDGLAALPDAGRLLQDYQREKREARQVGRQAQVQGGATQDQAAGDGGNTAQDIRALYRQAVQARMQNALITEAPFVERLVHFWSNHFCVSADNPQTAIFAGAFERDAIRPHVLGRFEDMLLAVEQHPGMLIYLNQAQSIGPDSMAAERAAARNPETRRGLNENLAREIMELHTLGVRTGYSQADVTEFARALTGWTTAGLGPNLMVEGSDPDAFLFRPQFHEPGARTILGRTYGQQGVAQARAVLTDFAAAPQTATHVATKLARHFAGDTPPPALIGRLATRFTATRGDLKALYATLVDSPEVWAAHPLKFKSPWEWSVSVLRGLGHQDVTSMRIAQDQTQLGQPVWKPGSPAGWDDVAATWAAPDALLRRVDLAQRLAAQAAATVDARSLAPKLLPASLSAATTSQIERAESPAVALALLFVSPEFLRR